MKAEQSSNDPWSAFGDGDSSDDDENENGNDVETMAVSEAATAGNPIADIVVSHLAQLLLKWDASIQLSQRYIGIIHLDEVETGNPKHQDILSWKEALGRKMMTNVIVIDSDNAHTPQTCPCMELESSSSSDNKDGINRPACPTLPDEQPNLDAAIWLWSSDDTVDESTLSQTAKALEYIQCRLVPGGVLVYPSMAANEKEAAQLAHSLFGEMASSWWNFDSLETISNTNTNKSATTSAYWTSIRKWPCRVATETCPWLSKKHNISDEYQRLATATVALSVHERQMKPNTSDNAQSITLSAQSIRAAVSALQTHGYCIVAGLLSSDRERCLAYGQAVLSDLHAAAAILKQNHGVDLYHPVDSTNDPDVYRELSMREEYRMDIRYGPALNAIRTRTQNGNDGDDGGGDNGISDTAAAAAAGNRPVTIRASDVGLPPDDFFLRGNANLLTIVRQVMNPVQSLQLSAGNFGRYNFDGGGPDGSFQALTAGIVGGIVSLPGSTDQAIHADTPHLFEHSADPPFLPAHYINVFTPGCPAVDRVGQTALVHGSHRLDFVARYVRTNDGSNQAGRGRRLDPFHSSIWEHLVRPRLDVGDVLIFDCRILHFGLANQHESVERPLLYTNMTMHWFHDPKNWEQQRRIFVDECE